MMPPRFIRDGHEMASNSTSPIKWRNLLTVGSASILVGTETVGAGVATGWALGGIFNLGATGQHIGMALFGSLGIVAFVAFFRRAVRVEPIR